MSTLQRWLPFKFRRKHADEKKAEIAADKPIAARPMASFFGMPMSQLMQEAFGEPFFRETFSRFGDLDQWFGDFAPAKFQPKVDVVDEEGALRVTAELPGMSKDDVQLSIEDDVLTIRGEKRNEEESKENGVFRTERYYGYTQRAVPLPSSLNHDKAEATFDKGVLTVRFPKGAPTPDKGTEIPIKG